MRHAQRTTGFFKVRGININHGEFEDLMFRVAPVNDFKCEAVAIEDLDVLRVSSRSSAAPIQQLRSRLVGSEIKRVFEITPMVRDARTGYARPRVRIEHQSAAHSRPAGLRLITKEPFRGTM